MSVNIRIILLYKFCGDTSYYIFHMQDKYTIAVVKCMLGEERLYIL